jgi:hypothetical protein
MKQKKLVDRNKGKSKNEKVILMEGKEKTGGTR